MLFFKKAEPIDIPNVNKSPFLPPFHDKASTLTRALLTLHILFHLLLLTLYVSSREEKNVCSKT